MRIVRHPNIVELKAFYYSNGERVRYPPNLFFPTSTF
jgi:glycogen synthase kinase 3 beta